MELQWNYNEFCTYLLIYASYSDLDFSKAEKDHILTKIDEESFKKIEKVYLDSTEFQRLQIIMDHKGLYYPTLPQKQELLGKMRELFDADGEYSTLEQNLNDFLVKLL
jgi:hypothetical protein